MYLQVSIPGFAYIYQFKHVYATKCMYGNLPRYSKYHPKYVLIGIVYLNGAYKHIDTS